MSCAVEWFLYGIGLSQWCCHMYQFNKWVFVQHSGIVCYVVIVIFYCANTTAFRMPHGKFSEWGRWVKLGFKIGCCMKKVENHCATELIKALNQLCPTSGPAHSKVFVQPCLGFCCSRSTTWTPCSYIDNVKFDVFDAVVFNAILSHLCCVAWDYHMSTDTLTSVQNLSLVLWFLPMLFQWH